MISMTKENKNFELLITNMSTNDILNEKHQIERRVILMVANDEDVERLVIIDKALKDRGVN